MVIENDSYIAVDSGDVAKSDSVNIAPLKLLYLSDSAMARRQRPLSRWIITRKWMMSHL